MRDQEGELAYRAVPVGSDPRSNPHFSRKSARQNWGTRRVTDLPRFEAVVVALAGDFTVSEFEEHGRVAAHLGARGESAEGNGESAGPEHFHGHEVVADDGFPDFVSLRGEDLAAFFESLSHQRNTAADAVRVNAVGELIEHHVGSQEARDVGEGAVFDGLEVAANGVEVVSGHGRIFA